MSCTYTPPSGSQVNFDLNPYTPPLGDSIVFELCPVSGVTMKVWTGVEFEDKPVLYWDGTEWATPSAVKTFNGTDFI